MLNHGHIYEKVAQQILVQHGLKLVDNNFKSRFGEIDLIMQEHQQLVFIEVKARTPQHEYWQDNLITSKQQSNILKTALLFMSQQQPHHTPDYRFDLFVLCIPSLKSSWLKNIPIIE